MTSEHRRRASYVMPITPYLSGRFCRVEFRRRSLSRAESHAMSYDKTSVRRGVAAHILDTILVRGIIIFTQPSFPREASWLVVNRPIPKPKLCDREGASTLAPMPSPMPFSSATTSSIHAISCSSSTRCFDALAWMASRWPRAPPPSASRGQPSTKRRQPSRTPASTALCPRSPDRGTLTSSPTRSSTSSKRSWPVESDPDLWQWPSSSRSTSIAKCILEVSSALSLAGKKNCGNLRRQDGDDREDTRDRGTVRGAASRHPHASRKRRSTRSRAHGAGGNGRVDRCVRVVLLGRSDRCVHGRHVVTRCG